MINIIMYKCNYCMQTTEKSPSMSNVSPDSRPLMDQKAASEFLSVTPEWLEKRRGPKGKPGGPPYIIMGGFIRYRPSALEEWVSKLEAASGTQ